MDFYDSDNFVHDNREATCGNKVLYSCMFREVGGYNKFQWYTIQQETVRLNPIKGETILTIRDHNNDNPDSLDNLFGFIYMGLINADELKRSGNYINSYDKDAHTWKECFTLMWEYRKEMKADRNYWWENNLDAVGKLSSWVPWHIQYYALKKDERIGLPILLRSIFFYMWLLSVVVKRNYKEKNIRKLKHGEIAREKQTGAISQKNIAWLVLSDLGSLWWIKLFKVEKNMRDYFGDENHPIIKHLSNK